ncbi:hypothetical protein [Myroides marinus]|uniref:hypothetical protein n=1 Tax=Myroides marinus TaxID=703342 RepID=UPI002575E403|nr:hypothetical protein [Myroides marinus]MDM1377878.1 hypothetical protein [Myroides marinus]MDM1383367.1 hypothetical protein [Myroides marinus]MDM1385149.1 hypothetical protein [Myroides marinus]MDM1392362.1 hypothetical protein [Myroides marinus]
MAGFLTDLTKINPFTIDQNRYSDKGEDRYNNPLSKLVVNNTYIVPINAEGEVFRGNPSSYETDISIIQSVNSFKTSLWWEELERKEFRIPKDKTPSYPALVLVYRKGEYTKNGIPTAVIELNLEEDDSKKIYLKDDDYEIVVLNSSYEVIYSL